MSKKAIGPVVLAALALVSTAALAATQTVTGDVKSTDSAKRELTLANGNTFELGSSIKLDKIKTGDKVAITYEMKNGKMVASKVKHEK